jgi:hypothetical protein
VRHGSGLVAHGRPASHAPHTPALQTMPAPQLVPFAIGVAESTHCDVPVAQEVTPATQGLGLPVHERFAAHVEQAPPLQTWSWPQAVPFGLFAPSTHADVPVEQEVTPSLQSVSGLPGQARPAVHEVHAPPLQTWSGPHAVPFGSATVASSTHVCVPVLHEVMPVRHGSGFVAQASPAVQEEQVPALHTRFVPQLVPFARSAPSTHWDVPVAQEVTPRLQSASGLPGQASPAAQVEQVPALQTLSVPQVVPFAIGVAVSTQVSAPVAHEVAPATHGFGLVAHARPAAQEEQVPALHTMFVPQLVPFPRAAPSTQTDAPVEQEVTPRLQSGSGLPAQSSPAVHETQAPALHTRFEPHAVPFDSGAAALSTQISVPVAQEVMPVRHGSGLPVQASPALQELHVPALHTMFEPQGVPSALFAPSVHVDVPVAQEVTPSLQSVSGFVAQPRPAVQAEHRPPLHTMSAPQVVPFGSGAAAWSTQSWVPVLQEVMPVRHVSGFVAQASPAVQEEQVPALHTRFVPQLVPLTLSAPSMHVEAPVEQEVTPSLQSVSGFVMQARPVVQAEQAPALQTMLVPQLVPFAICVGVSTQTCVPVEQEVVPATHGFGFVVHARPAAHGRHVPVLHTRFVPQLVPFARSAASRQTDVPVAHDVTPSLQSASGLVAQAFPAVHALQSPLKQTSGASGSTSQVVPFGIAVVVSRQTSCPVVQLVTPCTHRFGFVPQTLPAVHALQTPLRQTSGTSGTSSQAVPFGIGVAVFSQVSFPVAQEVIPATHSFPLVEQESPAVHAMQVAGGIPAGPVQTMFVPQEVPVAIATAVSTQVSNPVPHEVVPATQGFGFPVHAFPAVQTLQVPSPQTSGWAGSTSQAEPFATKGPVGPEVSVQTSNPVSQVYLPRWHGFAGVHAAPIRQTLHTPSPHTSFSVGTRSQEVPFGRLPSSTQSGSPVSQVMDAVWHGFAGGQGSPRLQISYCQVAVTVPPAGPQSMR